MASQLSFTRPCGPPPAPPTSFENSQLDCVEDASNWHNPPSLLSIDVGNRLPNADFSDFIPQSPEPLAGNPDPGDLTQDKLLSPTADLAIQRWLEVSQEASRVAKEDQQRIKLEAAQSGYIARMQQYLDSGDPILVAEALAWATINPGVLNLNILANNGQSASEIPEFSDTLAAISVCMQRLEWSKTQVSELLQQFFNKSSQDLLDDYELIQWRRWLETAISGNLSIVFRAVGLHPHSDKHDRTVTSSNGCPVPP